MRELMDMWRVLPTKRAKTRPPTVGATSGQGGLNFCVQCVDDLKGRSKERTVDSRNFKAVLVAGLIAVAGVIGAVGVGLPAESVGASGLTSTTATTVCDKALLADKPIATKQLAACKVVSSVVTTKCSHKPNVYEIGVGTGSDALLRVGHKPMVYTQANLYVSEATSLCGDPIDPSMTPPAPGMTRAQIQALLSKSVTAASTTTTAVASGSSVSDSCSAFFAKYHGVDTDLPGMSAGQAYTLIADSCSPSDLTTEIASSADSSADASAAPLEAHLDERLICPTNPHTKLCP
jgi:hypothetical protein